jgi:MIP family channel proteins
MNGKLFKQCVAEFIGTFALIFVGVGAIYHTAGFDQNAGLVLVALAHGLTIAVMASATGAISGGHLNPAVTFGLWVGGKISAKDSLAYLIAQLAGATAAGFVLLYLFTGQMDPAKGTSLANSILVNGTPNLAKTGINVTQGILIEAILTFFLVFVVYGTAVDARGPKYVAGLAIGLTVALDILFGGPFTGAAMNPARVFGPALASGVWTNQMIYWIGPLLGGAVAGLVYGRFLIQPAKAG